MKRLILLAFVVACGKTNKTGNDTASYPGTVPAVDSVVDKLPPDTLVNEQGQRCIVRPAPKYDVILKGDTYHNCNWK